MQDIDDYFIAQDCIYKDEHYSVRDNGAVMRHHRSGMRKRRLDDVWSFGTPNLSTGYLTFCGERVHRIVATAFHGEAPSNQHVVDHIDTNRQNNRPENLRWLSKLENILINEITRKKVELICGSIEAFLDNPQLLFGYETEDQNFSWMKNVTKEEAQNCLANWSHWAKTATPNPNYKKAERHVGEWIFSKSSDEENPFMNKIPDGHGGYRTEESKVFLPEVEEIKTKEEEDFLYDSITSSAKQRYWRTPTEFPCCPIEVTNDGLMVYMNNLEIGKAFSTNKFGTYYVVDKGFIRDNNNELIVLTTNTKNELISWAISTISIKDGKYIHENTKATAGKELTEKLFKYMIGKGELTEEDRDLIDCM